MQKLILFSQLVALMTFAQVSVAKSNVELMCRAKAKELALTTYSGCVTENKNKKIEKIRESYKKELQSLKSKYDKALKNLGEKETDSAQESIKTVEKTNSDALSESEKVEQVDADEVIEVRDL